MVAVDGGFLHSLALKNDGTVQSLLNTVAGLSNLASDDRALLERVEEHRRRQVDEFALDNAGLQRELRDGDILRVAELLLVRAGAAEVGVEVADQAGDPAFHLERAVGLADPLAQLAVAPVAQARAGAGVSRKPKREHRRNGKYKTSLAQCH